MFVTDNHYHLSLIFASKARAYPSGDLYAPRFGHNNYTRVEVLSLTNTLAYYRKELFTAINL